MIDLSRKKLFLFDLDGVLTAGKEKPVKLGGTRVINKIRASKGRKFFVLTNDSTDTVETVLERLLRFDIPVRYEEILTSARLTAEYVAKRHPRGTYFLVGERGLEEELDRVGLRRTRGTKADVVVVGLDRWLTYSKLDRAGEVARNGASIVACHYARLYMFKSRVAMAVGPIVKAIEYSSGKKAVAIGKPSRLMFELALEKAGCRPDEAVMVGDQEETDILGARRMGITSVMVKTGVYSREETKTEADAVVETVDDVAESF
ncbi:MAG TPA: HAD-IIA family hydrolase [Nitrososphaerales archaeon]|nr:HAD-IIA family hydrolase [Nitrososphaerales archaeon]